MFSWILFFTLIFVKLLQILWERRKFYALSLKLPGAFALPIIGNGLMFFNCKQEELFHKCVAYVNKYKSPSSLWFGPKFAVTIAEPKDIERIMSSQKFSQKHELYEFMHVLLGTGLVTGNGIKYKMHKKLVAPLVNLDFVGHNLGILHHNFSVLIKVLGEKRVENGIFNIKNDIHYCMADILANFVFGWDMRAQHGENHDFIEAVIETYVLVYERIVKPWLYPNILFQFSQNNKKFAEKSNYILQEIDKLIEKVNVGNVDKITGGNNLKPIMEYLAEMVDEEKFDKNDLKFHSITFYYAGEDTMTIITSFACVCFAIEKEYQRKAYEEIQSVFNGNVENATLADLNKLKYLEMCIKDVLRLFPIAPFIIRKILDDTRIGDLTYPAGTALLVCIHNVHRNAKYWLKPNSFYPDHFLPDVAAKRPNYTFLPFSAGPRMCVGKPLAYAGLKLAMSYILQNYELETDYKTLDDCKITADISVRALDGCKVRIKRRVSTQHN